MQRFAVTEVYYDDKPVTKVYKAKSIKSVIKHVITCNPFHFASTLQRRWPEEYKKLEDKYGFYLSGASAIFGNESKMQLSDLVFLKGVDMEELLEEARESWKMAPGYSLTIEKVKKD